jgi:hypothetical protein
MTDTSYLNLQSGSILFSEDGQSLISTQFKITNLTDVDIANLNHGSGTVKFLGVGSGSSTVTFQDAPSQSIKAGGVARDISLTSDLSVTGLGFTPKAVIFHYGMPTDEPMGVGMSDGSFDGAVANYDNIDPEQWDVSQTQSIMLFISPGNYTLGKIKSLDADGFTLEWAKTGSPTGTAYINYMAIG